MASLREIRNMAKGFRQYHEWRLRDLTEEQQIAAKQSMVEGVDAIEAAFDAFEEGDREAAVASLEKAIGLANKACDSIKG